MLQRHLISFPFSNILALLALEEVLYFTGPITIDCVYFRYGGSLGGPGTTMTLGRKGHYASLRAARTADTDMPFLGPNQGQYATLSKGCKTLESSDFY
jgi:hypothetical protein